MATITRYSIAVVDEICERISGGESLIKICEDENMPARMNVMRWLRNESKKYKYLRYQYARAREEQADFYVDSMVDMIDEEDCPQKARLKMDAFKWQASKLKPKKYGEKITQEIITDTLPDIMISLIGSDGKQKKII